ncbi:uncharacterized protein [Nicotiana tomentosiformis]|uniref:uncharacterized protein n=1 Tax=Nicotiana tomentosiformis TaxID=4098 RepID=UPI00388C9ACE
MGDTTQAVTAVVAQYDSNHAYFLYSSDAPTPAINSKDYHPWSRSNNMINLEQRFGQSNGAKLFHLQKQLNDLVQGTNDIAGYYTKLKKLWDELDSLNTATNYSRVCVCGGKKKLGKSLEDERLIHFLMGLNETYAPARSSILMLNPLPTVNHAYSLLLQDENQRQTLVYNQIPGDSASFMAGNQGFSITSGNQAHAGQRFTGNLANNSQYVGNSNYKGKKPK